jgi:hypothetical protein
MTLVQPGLVKISRVTQWSELEAQPTHCETRFAGQIMKTELPKEAVDGLWPVGDGTMTISQPLSIALESAPNLTLPKWAKAS